MKSRPYIGISMRLTRHRTFKDIFIHGIPQDYIGAVSAVGAIPVLLPVLEQGPVLQETLALIDGLIISGSDNYINPSLWGENPDPLALELCPQSRIETEFDLSLLRYSWSHGLPVLGICQGHELINIALGGTLKSKIGPSPSEWLEQHKQRPSDKSSQMLNLAEIDSPQIYARLGSDSSSCVAVHSVNHDKRCLYGNQANSTQAIKDQGKPEAAAMPSDILAHQIAVQHDSQLAEILLQDCPFQKQDRDKSQVSMRQQHPAASPHKTCSAHSSSEKDEMLLLRVNSFHGLSVGRLAPCLEATAFAEDGTIEALEWRKDLRQRYPFMLGVQWHPEMLLCSSKKAPSLANKHIPMQSIFTRLVAEADNFRRSDVSQRRTICFQAESEHLSFLPYWRQIAQC